MSATSLGPIGWGMTRDDDGHRTYKIGFKVQSTSVDDGPLTILGASGLPTIGSTWSYGNDSDSWAFCYPTATVSMMADEDQPGFYWRVDRTFSTKPLRRCQTDTIENPLSEPQKISGSFVRHMRKADKDKDGNLILSSSHEPIQGIERNSDRHTVNVEQNVANLGLATVTAIINHLNDATLWGVDARKILFSGFSWERLLYGTCTYYYKRRFEFEVRNNPDDGFDLEDVADMGFKELDDTIVGADKDNPTHFRYIKDKAGENTPVPLMLDNNGEVNTDPVGSPAFRPTIEIYGEANLLTLSIPTSL